MGQADLQEYLRRKKKEIKLFIFITYSRVNTPRLAAFGRKILPPLKFYDQILDLCHSRENGNPESRFRIKCGMTFGDTPLLAAGLFILMRLPRPV